MCGVSFILSKNKNNIIKNIFNSLKLIQNRGYDSIGICYYNNNLNKYDIIKNAENECFHKLEHYFNIHNIYSYVALGHTRWATHGKITENNSHPHISNNGKIILVHNGIIDNFIEIKNMLILNKFKFYSDTDSEVIANLIEYYILFLNLSIEEAIKKMNDILKGTWALIIVYKDSHDTFYITKNNSPLLFGSNNEYIIATSEINGFVDLIHNYIILDNFDIIKINNNSYNSINNNIIKYNFKQIDIDHFANINNLNYDLYNHWMLKEIMEQNITIEKAIKFGERINNNIIKLESLEYIKNNYSNKIQFIILIGCGTSYNAALLAENYFKEIKCFISVSSFNACEFTEYDLPNVNNYKNILCIFLSQSGETIDVFNSLQICKNKGCITMGIINITDSLISRNVECRVYLNAGIEVSVASTKSFTSMSIVLSLVSLWFNQFYNNNYLNEEILISLKSLPNTITSTLFDFKFMKTIENLTENIILNNINNIFILGKNKLYPIANEAALKIKEVSYIHAEGFSAGSLKHGPFALLDNSNLSILLIDYNDIISYNNLKSTYYEILGRDTNLFIITNSNEVINELNINENNYLLLYNLNYYNEILFTISFQYLAYKLSIRKNINPDKPRNLAKVVTVH